jgi:RHS repeat-associated protein
VPCSADHSRRQRQRRQQRPLLPLWHATRPHQPRQQHNGTGLPPKGANDRPPPQRRRGVDLHANGAPGIMCPALGRFASADILVPDPTNPQAYNRYSYAYNNPIKYTDPTRHDPLGQQWVAQFTEAHGRSPAWFDELIRLFSIAYPDEWDWGSFYNPDGTLRGFGTTLITPPASRSWDTLPDALGRLEEAYSKDEKDFFVRDIAFLYAGMSGRSQNPGWKGMRPYWTLGTFPGNSFVYLQSGSLPQHFYVTPTGDHDADYNVHHWVWSFAMGYEVGFAETALVNMTREVGAAYNRGVPYDASDFYLGTAGALGGAAYANSDESISTVLSSSLTVSPHALKTGVQLSPVILSFQYGLWP